MEDFTPARRCTCCGTAKPATTEFFEPHKRSRYGVLSKCRECRSARRKALRAPKLKRRLKVEKPKPEAKPTPKDGYQFCYECKAELPLTAAFFNIGSRRKSGFDTRCKECRRALKRREYPRYAEKARATVQAWRAENPDKVKEGQKAWRENNPEKARANWRNCKARRKNAPGKHTAQDVTSQFAAQRGRCYWCQSPLITEGEEKYHVDHLIPLNRGGTNDAHNIVCACRGCNCSRSDRLPHEWTGRLL